MRTLHLPPVACSLITLCLACGTPSPPAAPAPEPPPPPAAPASSPTPSVASAEPPASPPPAPAAQKPSRPPREVITQPDVTFLLNFQNSAPGEAAEQSCTRDAAGDPSKVGPCLSRAQDKAQTHAIRFVQDAQKNWWWHVMRRNGSQMLILHKVRIDFGEETDKTIVIQPKGKDEGMAPWGLLPKNVSIEVVDEFTVSMQDPQEGKLVFEARLGAVK